MSRQWKIILTPLILLMLSIILAACSGNDDATIRKVDRTEEVEEKGAGDVEIELNEHGVDRSVVQQVEAAIHTKFQLLDDGDYEKYLETFDGDKNDNLLSQIQDLIEADTISKVENIEVLYQKDNEVLATYDLILMTEVYNPDKNFNRDASAYAILHLVDEEWNFIIDHFVSLKILDAKGQPDPIFDYMNYDHKMAWWAERNRLIKLGLIPSEWFNEVLGEQLDEAVALPDQPLQMTQEERNSINPNLLAQIQSVLNGYGPPPPDAITLEELNFYPEELENGVFMFGCFIRNGYDYAVEGLVGNITIFVKHKEASGKVVEMEIGGAEVDLSDFGALEGGNTFLSTLYLDEETILVNLMELNFETYEVLAEFSYSE